jgi:hypothetical protein
MKYRVLLVAFVFQGFVFGQTPAELLKMYQDRYPKEQGMHLLNEQYATIKIDKSGKLLIEVNYTEEQFFLTDDASKFSKDRIYYSGFEKVDQIKAFSLIPSGKKYNKIPIRNVKTESAYSSNIFFDDVKRIEFDFPGLIPGAKTLLTYRRTIEEPRFFGRFFFSTQWPGEEARFVVRFPSEVKLKYLLYGLDTEGVQIEKTADKKDSIYTFYYQNPPATRDGVNSLPSVYRVPHVVVFVDSYIANGEEVILSRNVDALYDWYYSLVENVNSEEDPALIALANQLTENATNEREMVEAIYYWVQRNIKYIAIEDGMEGFVPRPAAAVYQRRYGDCKDMSSIIHTLLRAKGIEAYLTWVGTDAIPYKYTDLPTTKTDNHMICTYFDGEDYFFLDGTASFLPLGLNPDNIQGKQVLVGRGPKDFLVIDVPETPAESSFFRDSVHVKIDGSKLIGSGVLRTGGHFSERFSSIYGANAKEKRREQFIRGVLSKGSNKFLIDKYELLNPLEIGQPFDVAYDFNVDSYITSAGNEWFLNPHLEKQIQNEFIKEGTRMAHFTRFATHHININRFEIPKGFKIENLPENVSIESEDLFLSCSYKIKDGILEVVEEVKLKNRMIPEARFQEFNDFIAQANSVYKKTITLKKINP